MKVCLINNVFYPEKRGGADRITKIMADGLIESGHEVFLVCVKPRVDDYAKNNYRIYYFSSWFYYLKKIPFLFRLFWHLNDIFNIKNYFRIKRILKLEKPDLVITHNLKGLGYTIPRAIKTQKIKHFHVLHDIQLLYPSGLMFLGEEKKINGVFARIYARFCAWQFKQVDVVISPSRWLLEKHKTHNFFPRAELLVLPNPIKSEMVINDFKNRDDFFVCVGEIEEHKGVFLLVKVFKELNKKGKKIKIIFIGQGSDTDKLSQVIKEYKNIEYLGKLPNDKTQECIKKARGLIVASTCYENSPTVIYEAATAGTPVIASRLGGITELVHHLGGYLFSPGNKEDLLGKIKYSLKHPDEFSRTGIKSQLKVKVYSEDIYLKKIIDLVNLS